MPRLHFKRKFRGQGMVEFGLVAPIFFLMLFGIIEIGHYMFINHQVSNAAREGARWAIVRGENSEEAFTEEGVRDEILERVSGLDPANLTVSVTSTGTSIGSTVTVTTTYNYQPLIGMVLGTGTMTITRSSEMAIQY